MYGPWEQAPVEGGESTQAGDGEERGKREEWREGVAGARSRP